MVRFVANLFFLFYCYYYLKKKKKKKTFLGTHATLFPSEVHHNAKATARGEPIFLSITVLEVCSLPHFLSVIRVNNLASLVDFLFREYHGALRAI